MAHRESGDIVFTDGSTELSFMLAVDEQNRPRLRKYRAPVLAPQSHDQGPLSFTDKPPEQDYVLDIGDMSDGYGQVTHDPGDRKRYFSADGLDLRFGRIQPAASLEGPHTGPFGDRAAVDFLIRHGSFENSASTYPKHWTIGSNTAVARDTTAANVNSGGASAKTTASGSNAGLSQALTNPTVFRSKAITVYAQVKTSAVNRARLRVDDSVGNGTAGSYHTGGGAFELLTATKTIHASASSVTIQLLHDTTSGDVYWDSVAISLAGGNEVNGFQEFKGDLYAIVGRYTCKWDDSNDVWDVVDYHSQSTQSILNSRGVLAVTYQGGGLYNTSTDGSSWTSIALTRRFMAVARGRTTAGIGTAVWSNIDDVTLKTIADVTDATNDNWTAYTNYIGGSDRAITGIYVFNDIPYVGKEDGLWVYDRVNDTFQDLLPEFNAQPSADNFSKGMAFKGWLYLVTAQQGLVRLTDIPNGLRYEEIGSQLASPQSADFGGRIRALSHDTNFLYVVQDRPVADNDTSKTTWIIAGREAVDPITGITRFRWHTLHEAAMGEIGAATTFFNSTHSTSHLYIGGRLLLTGSAYKTVMYRMHVPQKHINPTKDTSPVLTTEGTLVTSYWESEFPDSDKEYLYLTVISENLDDASGDEIQYVLSAEVDDDTSFTTIGTNDTSPTQTFSFDALTAIKTGKRIRIKAVYANNLNVNSSGEIRHMILHAALRPVRFKVWDMWLDVGKGIEKRGAVEHKPTKTLVDQLDTWVDTVAHLDMTDFRGDTQTVYIINAEEFLDEIGENDIKSKVHVVVQEIKES